MSGSALLDAHHHLWDGRHARYQPAYTATDLQHTIGADGAAIVAVECGSGYRRDGPSHLRPVGETEWVAAAARAGAPIAALVAFADLRLGRQVGEVLDAHRAAAPQLLAGVRYTAAWSDAAGVRASRHGLRPGLLADAALRRGAAELALRGLVFETWLYWPQLDDVTALARDLPQLTVVLDHLGGPASLGRSVDEADAGWRRALERVAAEPNVRLKLSGLGSGQLLAGAPAPVGAQALAVHWAERVRWCLELFGADRCMFATNYPSDGRRYDFPTLLQTLQLLAAPLPPPARAAVLGATARATFCPAPP